MRIRPAITLSALALTCALGAGIVGTAAVASAEPDDSTATSVGGVPAPIFVTPAMLDGGTLDVVAGQIVIVTASDGSAWTGDGGANDSSVAQFAPASSSEDVDFNAGFTIGEGGSTGAWITDGSGHRADFEIRVAA